MVRSPSRAISPSLAEPGEAAVKTRLAVEEDRGRLRNVVRNNRDNILKLTIFIDTLHKYLRPGWPTGPAERDWLVNNRTGWMRRFCCLLAKSGGMFVLKT